MPERIGFIGAGLMGHGMAKNIVEKGYPLRVLAHRNRAPIEDLLARGATEAESPAALARASDIVILCVPSSVEVELCVFAEDGIMAGAHEGLIVIDCTTAEPPRPSASPKRSPPRTFASPMPRSPARPRTPRPAGSTPWSARTRRRLPRSGPCSRPSRRTSSTSARSAPGTS